MSTIKVRTNERELVVLEHPTIPACGINIDTINVTFDDSWTGYAKKCGFYTSEKKTPIFRTVDSSNNVKIPASLIGSATTLFFGFCGTNGNNQISSTILRYEIEKGIASNVANDDPDYVSECVMLNQGVNNAGNLLIVGSDGNVIAKVPLYIWDKEQKTAVPCGGNVGDDYIVTADVLQAILDDLDTRINTNTVEMMQYVANGINSSKTAITNNFDKKITDTTNELMEYINTHSGSGLPTDTANKGKILFVGNDGKVAATLPLYVWDDNIGEAVPSDGNVGEDYIITADIINKLIHDSAVSVRGFVREYYVKNLNEEKPNTVIGHDKDGVLEYTPKSDIVKNIEFNKSVKGITVTFEDGSTKDVNIGAASLFGHVTENVNSPADDENMFMVELSPEKNEDLYNHFDGVANNAIILRVRCYSDSTESDEDEIQIAFPFGPISTKIVVFRHIHRYKSNLSFSAWTKIGEQSTASATGGLNFVGAYDGLEGSHYYPGDVVYSTDGVYLCTHEVQDGSVQIPESPASFTITYDGDIYWIKLYQMAVPFPNMTANEYRDLPAGKYLRSTKTATGYTSTEFVEPEIFCKTNFVLQNASASPQNMQPNYPYKFEVEWPQSMMGMNGAMLAGNENLSRQMQCWNGRVVFFSKTNESQMVDMAIISNGTTGGQINKD